MCTWHKLKSKPWTKQATQYQAGYPESGFDNNQMIK